MLILNDNQKQQHLKMFKKLLSDGVDPQKVVNILTEYIRNVEVIAERSREPFTRDMFEAYLDNAAAFRKELVTRYDLYIPVRDPDEAGML